MFISYKLYICNMINEKLILLLDNMIANCDIAINMLNR